MTSNTVHPVAVVGTAAIMPGARDAATFWANITGGVYSITDVPPERWDPTLYFDEDHSVPDKTYSRIGGWVRDFPWEPAAWKLPVPPKVAQQMDLGQQWAISAARSALVEAGWPGWDVDTDRVAVIFGNAIGGEKHYQTSMRIKLPEVLRRLAGVPSLTGLPPDVQQRIIAETREAYLADQIDITEDTMPGELSNVIAGRVANLFNLRGPNFTTDAACASGLAALNAAVQGLVGHEYDVAVTGGIDRNMGVDAFVKFCKIGALSATGTRPFDAGADGFVMGEGAAFFVLKRLEDAEAAGDRIHAVILGVGGSSDGKGKGITAPNPVGQKLAVERAWARSGQDPSSAGAVEAHGTSTRVGDASELNSLTAVFGTAKPGSIALGSVKSNIGHLKAAAGAAGLLKMVYSLREKTLAPSLNFVHPNENVDWDSSPFKVNTELREWPEPSSGVRTGGVSAFGFGGTNFHVVLEEHVPGRHKAEPKVFASAAVPPPVAVTSPLPAKPPLRGALVLGAADDAQLLAAVRSALADARGGRVPTPAVPSPATLASPVRVAIDYADAPDLAGKLDKLDKALTSGNPALFRMLRQQGAFVGRGPAPKVAFLYTGQGSQYVNMLQGLALREQIVGDTFAEADSVMTPLLGRSLSSYIFIDGGDPAAVKAAEKQLLQTEITQPAVLATDLALTRLLSAYGIAPDMVMGHSLGEYGALVAAGSLTFESALEAVSARGREMASLSIDDNGAMAAAFGPLSEIERIVGEAEGYVVIANINSNSQAVIGGATVAVERVVDTLNAAGINAIRIPVSHAFHTTIVAPASVPLVAQLRRLDVRGPQVPCVANVTGEFYPTGADTDTMLDYLGKQVASPVQFVRGLRTLYDAGARVFVEVGPKKALHGFVEDVLGEHDDVLALYTNHPKLADEAAFNQALCGLYASGLGAPVAAPSPAVAAAPAATSPTTIPEPTMASDDTIHELGLLFAGVLEQGLRLYGATPPAVAAPPAPAPAAAPTPSVPARPALEPVVITGAGLGLPGRTQVFGDGHVADLLAGQQFIGQLSGEVRDRMVDMRITRLIKSESKGASFATIDDPAEVIKLAGLHAPLDVVEQFGIDAARDEALDNATRLAIGSGLEALRDAGVPIVLRYKTTTLGTQLPDRWGLPEELRDDTGVIFASAFPGFERLVEAVEDYAFDKGRRDQILALEGVLARMPEDASGRPEVERALADIRAERDAHPYEFDRRFLFRVLSMGHSQFADLIGARGPNTQVNAACASTTQALSLAEDWIRSGRCRRVVVVSADDATGERMMPWIGAGFLASGAAATDERVEDAATPFDRRRHGMIIGMGAAAFVVESAEAARERGIQPICEVLGAVTANSAFHGTRLDVEHIAGVMEAVVSEAERHGIDRAAIAPQTVFVSHETYTPARGGSASAEIHALRTAFGPAADGIVITNTKGFTGHAMGTGIEDVLAIKALETGIVPAVPNYREPDPDLGNLNLSTGGSYPVEYALRLAAGFGSQIAMSLLRRVPMPDGRRRAPEELGYAYRIVDQAAWQRWLDRLSGHPGATLEVDHRRLRVVDTGAPAVPVAARTHVPVPYADAPVAQLAATPVEKASQAPARDVAPAPAAAVVVPQPPAAPAAAPVEVDPVLAEVTRVVAEMTGYPPELLDPDLDLEADLGVDTVKQAEVFAAVRGHYDLERDDNLRLRDFPTLNHVAGWVRDKTGMGAFVPAAAPAAAPAVAPSVEEVPQAPSRDQGPVIDPVLAEVTRVVAEMTGYPPELLDPDLDLEADLGVDTVKQAEVFAAVRAHYDVERDDSLQLRDFPTLNHVTGWVRDKTGMGAFVPAAAPAAAPAAVPLVEEVPQAPSRDPGDPVLATVTKVVAEMTGYPEELLDPDLDLEADLGVDTVKQAEVFAAVRAHYDVERDDSLQLRDFPTLNHVAGWVRDKTGMGVFDAAPAAVETPATQPAAGATATQPAVAPSLVQGDLAAIDALPRRIPVPSLRPPVDQCSPTGVDLAEARVVVMLDEGGVGAALLKRLEKAGATALPVEPGTSTDDLLAALEAWLADGPVDGVYWLPALDDEGDLADADAWTEALRRRVKALYATMRRVYDASPFLVAATKLGGLHGYDGAGATSPLGGAVTGFTKSYKKERPDALVKAVDLPASRKTAAVADLLIEETLGDPGCVEIGRVDGRRYGVAFREVPFTPLGEDGSPLGEGGVELGPDSVVVVTGAAGSIVSAITADLAGSGATFHLLDLTATPDRDDPDLAAFRSDRDGLKATIMARMQERGERPTPVAIEKELAGLERREAALSAVEAVEASGGTAVYHCVDLTDGDAVAAALADVGDRVDVLLHAAGLEISRSLPDKEPREFDLVFDVKVNGWRHVWSALAEREVGAVVVFSSVAGRFGNNGQTDYAAANDLLCKTVSSLRRTRPQTRGLALDWTAWGGIGMATRGSIPKIMEMAGVQMLPPEAGVAWIRRELASSPFSGEVIVAGALGLMATEYDPSGGLAETDGYPGTMLGQVSLSVCDGLVAEVTLDPAEQPFLDHHRIDGTPVLPGVMGMEAFAEAAGLLAPEGLPVVAVENVHFLAPVKFYRDEPRTLRIALTTEPDGDDLVAHAVLSAERVLPGQSAPVRTVHFTGDVRLSAGEVTEEHVELDPNPAERQLGPEQVYSFYFHGPAYQVVDAAWRADGAALGRLSDHLPQDRQPADARLVNAPRLVELCFQTAGLWQAGRDHQLALPLAVDRVSVRSVEAVPEGEVYAVAREVGPSTYDAVVATRDGRVLVRLDGYHSIPVPMPIPDDVAGPLTDTYAD